MSGSTGRGLAAFKGRKAGLTKPDWSPSEDVPETPPGQAGRRSDHAGSSQAASVREPMDGLRAGLESAGPPVPKNGRVPAPRRDVVRVACEYMMEHLEQTASAPTLSNVASVSIRTLDYAFKEILGVPPMAYYRALRFSAARRALRRPGSPACTVTSVATRFGFFHLGRFSVEYRSRFHESPSATLERSSSVLRLSRALGEPRATKSPGTPIRSAS